MLKFTKRTEYALMAMREIALVKDGSIISAKEIAERNKIPFELLSKILQNLNRSNIIFSTQGIKGGYALLKDPEIISLLEIIKAVEPNYQIVECFENNSNKYECSLLNCCQIRNPVAKLQKEIDKLLKATKLKNIM
ncbi:MAG TPA: Rrf2 family transcriptional regulator [Ignavibacteriaceae bacterium]|nr:Rrf2 family transcriptional regulator [Ignavibacteriaceae bacterium]